MIESFGAGEVAHDQRDAMIAGIDPGNEALRLREREAEPVHAGVDMNAGASGPAGAAAEHIPFGKLVEIADHRPGVDLGVGVAAVLEEAVEHVDRSRRHRGAGGAGLVQGGDEKRLAAGAGERARHRFEPAAIGVGLDHAGAFGRHRGFLELAPVGDDARRDRPCSTPVAVASAAAWFASGESTLSAGINFGSEMMFMPHFTRAAAAVQPGEGASVGCVPAGGCHASDRRTASGWPRTAVRPCRSDRGAACR